MSKMQEITVFNNLTKKRETLVPKHPPALNIYTCGPTVYDDSHIGHARSAITWDFIIRYLRHAGFKVNWARNITDIDDKIINRAKELKISANKVARIFTYSFYEDMVSLGVDWPDHEPQATQYLQQMFNFIEGLLQKGFAYRVDSDIYFSIANFKDYGKLKGQSISELEKGFGRIEPNEKKKNKLDFALWKGVKKSEYGFDSPWGKGRPGWHLECSTMNYSIFGENLDIHGGGDDLIFPHHENEIAQSEAFTGKQFAKYWLHNGMILINDKKMAKSEGNYITIKDALNNTSSSALRLFVLNTHYRMPLNYTDEAIISAQNGISRLKEALTDYKEVNGSFDENKINISKEDMNEFNIAMANDFNSSQGLAVLFNLADKINIEKNETHKSKYQNTLIRIAQVLGLELLRFGFTKDRLTHKSFKNMIEMLINWRKECKANKDFKDADKIREILIESNIEVKDLPDGKYKWQFKL